MARFTSLSALAASASLAGLVALGVASCSLGLDERLLDKVIVEGPPQVADAAGEAAVVDAGDDAADASAPVDPECASDEQCTTADGCLHGKCDLTRKRCTYDVCRPAACSAGACDRGAKTCSAAAAYPFKAAQFDVGSRVTCARCAAAVYPWLFVVSGAGLVAFDVSNPANATPNKVPVVGLGFVPTAIVQSGSRLWFTGAVTGDGPSRLQIAYLDVPTDPFTTPLTATTVLATYGRKAESLGLFSRGGDSALLIGQAAPLAATAVEGPLVEPADLTATPFVAAANFGPSAVSGKRLLMSAVVNQAASFYLVDNAGTPTPSNGAITNLTSAGAVSTQRVFASAPDGTIFWATGAHQAASTRAAKGYFLVGSDGAFVDGQEGVDIEVYTGVANNAAVFGTSQGTAAMVDANTVMVATQAHENAAQTAIQFVTRFPLGLVKDATGTMPLRQVLPVRIADVIATAGSRGIGYVVANDQSPAGPATVYAFDPACAP